MSGRRSRRVLSMCSPLCCRYPQYSLIGTFNDSQADDTAHSLSIPTLPPAGLCLQGRRDWRWLRDRGAVFGFLTAVVLIPDRHVGFSIEINSEDGEIIRGLMCELLDHY